MIKHKIKIVQKYDINLCFYSIFRYLYKYGKIFTKSLVMCGNIFNVTETGIAEGYGNFSNSMNMDRP